MLRIANTQSDNSINEDEDIISLKNRKSQAESEFLIICEDKKRVLAETESLAQKNEAQKDIITANKQEIEDLKEEIVDINSKLESAKQNLNIFIDESNKHIDGINKSIDGLNKTKSSIAEDVRIASKKYELEIASYEKALKDLFDKKTVLETETDELKQVKSEVTKAIKLTNEELAGLNKQLKTLGIEVTKLEKLIADNNETVKSQNTTIKQNKSIIAGQDTLLKQKEAELLSYDVKISKKEEEYKTIEQRAFNILNREEQLNNKEVFIRAQYERAGIKFE